MEIGYNYHDMRKEFLQIAKELEEHDLWFRDVLSKKTTIPTEQESWSVRRDVALKLYKLVQTHRPKHILEVGTSLGFSTIWIAEATREYGGIVDTIEVEESKVKKAKETFLRLGYENVCTHLGDSLQILSRWQRPIDLLFLDARKRDYVHQLRLAEQHFSKGAIIVADDVTEWRRKLDEFFDYLDGNGAYRYEVLGLGHGLLVGRFLG